jgi:hypothetical protein
MEIWTLVEKIRDALKDNADIKAWCQAVYGSDHTIYIGYDERKPPPKSAFPVLVICPVEQERTLNVDYGPMMIEVGYGIEDDTETTVDNVVTYAGVQNVLGFRAAVETILFGLKPDADLGGAWIESAHELIEPVELFPIFLSNVLYTFRNPDRFSTILNQT